MRAFVAVVLWLGLAALDLGPRASPAFVPGMALPHGDCDTACGAGSCGATDPSREFHTVFPAPDEGQPIHWVQPGCGSAPSGGAGAPSSGSSQGPTGPVFNIVAAVQFGRPAL